MMFYKGDRPFGRRNNVEFDFNQSLFSTAYNPRYSGTLCGTTCQVISEMFLFVLVLCFGLFSFLRGEALLAVLSYGVDALVF